MLLALFPANIVATAGAIHPAAPSTPLIPRLLLQVVFMGFAVAPLFLRRSQTPSTPLQAAEAAAR